VPGVYLCQRTGAFGELVAGEDRSAAGGSESIGIQAELEGETAVQLEQSRIRHLGRLRRHVEAFELTRVAVVEVESGIHHQTLRARFFTEARPLGERPSDSVHHAGLASTKPLADMPTAVVFIASPGSDPRLPGTAGRP
jgi:hypothetical protein